MLIQAISIAPLQVHYTQRCSRQSTDTVSEFHSEAPQATVSEGLAQSPYVAARAGLEPTTLRRKGADSTNEPPRPQCCCPRQDLSMENFLINEGCSGPTYLTPHGTTELVRF